MTEDSEEAILVSAKELEQVTCIQYPITFPGGVTQDGSILDSVSALLDSGSKVNAIHPAFAKRLGFVVRTTNVGTQKIDGTTLETNRMMVAAFSVTDQANKIKFFEETFLVANVSPDMVLEMLFFILNSANVDFSKRELWWRSYTIKEALPITKRVEIIGKKEFVAVALDPGHETFVVHVASLESPSSIQEDDVNPSYRAQIAALVANETSTFVSTKYFDFVDVFSLELASKLLEYTEINDHAIELVDDWQPLYRPIYSPGPVKLKTLKTYIKTNLANSFIKPSKSPAGASIFFDKKPNGRL